MIEVIHLDHSMALMKNHMPLGNDVVCETNKQRNFQVAHHEPILPPQHEDKECH